MKTDAVSFAVLAVLQVPDGLVGGVLRSMCRI
jgi:hypothetical protein